MVNKINSILLWSLLPILCFTLALFMTKWINETIIGTTSTDYQNLINVLLIVCFLLCLLGCGIGVRDTIVSQDSLFSTSSKYLFIISYIVTCFIFFCVTSWLFDTYQFKVNLNNYAEWITVIWVISEIGLLSGVISRLKEDTSNSKYNIFKHNKDKYKEDLSPQGEWIEVNGDDTLIINSDGTLYHITEDKTYKLIFQVLDNGDLVAQDDDKNIIIVNFEAHPSYISWRPIKKVTFKGKEFTRYGDSYEYAVKENDNLQKRYREYKEIKKIFHIYDNNGSWVNVILYSIPSLFGITALIFCIIEKTSFDKLSIVGSITTLIFIGLIARNLWLILNRKKKQEVIRIFDQSFGKLPLSDLINYIHTCLRNPQISIDEWKSIKSKKRSSP